MNEVARTLKDFGGILERLGLSFAVIGGIAVRAYAIPRPTFDIDFTLAIPRQRLAELFREVEQCGYSVPESYQSGCVDAIAKIPLVKIRRYLQGQGVDIDIFLAENYFLKEVVRRRRWVETPDAGVWLASPEDVVLLKLLSNRGRDAVDVTDVLFTQGDVDRDYMRHWAHWLGVTDRLEDAFRVCDGMV